MFRKLIGSAGMFLLANAACYMPLIASAQSDTDQTVGIIAGFPIGAIATGAWLVSLSRTKKKATKAKEFSDANIMLEKRTDVFDHKTTS